MFRSLVTSIVLGLASIGADAASFIPLGDLAGGQFASQAWGISADGAVVVGVGSTPNGYQAFRWTGGVMTGLGFLPSSSPFSIARSVSADGAVVVGHSQSRAANGYAAYRWTDGGGMVDLGYLPGNGSGRSAYGVSADGSVVVGVSGLQAYRWTGGVMTGIGSLLANGNSAAYGVSANGAVVVGDASSGPGTQAFRWTDGGGMVGIGDLPGGIFLSAALGVSANGAVVVGQSYSAYGREAFRWTSEGGMVGLGDFPGGEFNSSAAGASADGSVVIGTGTGTGCSASCSQGFVWTQANGMQRLFDVLVANGATGLTGWNLGSPTSISADGRWVAGIGTNPLGQSEAFLANISPVPIPPAVYLFGSALGLMGVMRRKVSN
jgi:probable HAF family extracellular repeat protein